MLNQNIKNEIEKLVEKYADSCEEHAWFYHGKFENFAEDLVELIEKPTYEHALQDSLVPCPACSTRPDPSKASCLLIAEHTGKYGKVSKYFADHGYHKEDM